MLQCSEIKEHTALARMTNSQQGRILNSKHRFQSPFAAPPRKVLSAILPSKNLTVSAGNGFRAQDNTMLQPRLKWSEAWNHLKALTSLWQPPCNTTHTAGLHFYSLQRWMLNQAVTMSLARRCAAAYKKWCQNLKTLTALTFLYKNLPSLAYYTRGLGLTWL